jgi:hypothetical protein
MASPLAKNGLQLWKAYANTEPLIKAANKEYNYTAAKNSSLETNCHITKLFGNIFSFNRMHNEIIKFRGRITKTSNQIYNNNSCYYYYYYYYY